MRELMCLIIALLTLVENASAHDEDSVLLIRALFPEEISQDKVVLKVYLDQPGPAFIRYGSRIDNLENTTPREERELDYHRQSLTGLDSGGKYYFQIVSGSKISQIFTISTPGHSNNISPPSNEEAEQTSKEKHLLPLEDLGVSNLRTHSFTANTAGVKFVLDKPGPAGIEFGLSATNLDLTAKEETRTFAEHNQRLTGLTPGRRYYFRIISGGLKSKIFYFDFTISEEQDLAQATSSPSENSESLENRSNSPSNAARTEATSFPQQDNDLPHGGLFYGNPYTGTNTANAPISIFSARRFRAERTGYVKAVRHNNRTLTQSNIDGRCKSGEENSVWCQCKNAGLDSYLCGYALGNSYSVGNGGLISVELREDDGTPQHLPGKKLLGKTKTPYVPKDTSNYPTLELENPAFVEAGKIYHLVYRNLNPPNNCRLRGQAYSDARNCPRNSGAIGLNGYQNLTVVGPTERFGPLFGNIPAVLIKSKESDQWSLTPKVLSWYELIYEDDVSVGNTSVAIYWDEVLVQGQTEARQRFRVTDRSRSVSGFWLSFGHSKDADGKSLTYELKDSSGRRMALGSIPSSKECLDKVRNPSESGDGRCRTFAYSSFTQLLTLEKGQEYFLEFNAPPEAGFSFWSYLDMAHYGATNRNHWHDSQAERSLDGGRSWKQWVGSFPERDLAVLFTIEGKPTQYN